MIHSIENNNLDTTEIAMKHRAVMSSLDRKILLELE